VANPASTDWLFFVSGDDGVTYFSKTVEEHEALVAQHCKTLCN
jgi:cell division protein YceG involved in septum cleavage